MRVLALNIGSSSIKFAIYEIEKTVALLFQGSYTSIKSQKFSLLYRLESNGKTYTREVDADNSITTILDNFFKILTELNLQLIHAIGHRVVHGGSHSNTALRITSSLIEEITDFAVYCPLHTPAILEGISHAQAIWPNIPQIAVFDTSFHQTIPEYATTYAIPKEWRQLGIRKYGFHGLSHEWVRNKVYAEFLDKSNNLKIISCHLGSGSSICAIHNGISIDTSMGVSPLGGLVMETRPGDLDPAIAPIVSKVLGLKIEDIYHALFYESGLKALVGKSSFAEIEVMAKSSDAEAIKAIKIYTYRIKQYIGSYIAAMNGVDALVFTGGIGENSEFIRSQICQGLSSFGINLDADKNENVSLKTNNIHSIHGADSKVHVFIVPSNEQAVIAMETNNLLSSNQITTSLFNDYCMVPISVSARHIHLSKKDISSLFGDNYELHKLRDLNQPNTWAAKETVTLIGPNGTIDKVRILAPAREKTQIEVSKSDAIHLGIDVPIRESGKLDKTPFIVVKGAHAYIRTDGLIIAQRHIHTNPQDAVRLRLQNGSKVCVSIMDGDRKLIFDDVLVRVSEHFKTEIHIDTDEANASNISYALYNELGLSEQYGQVTHS